MVLAVKRLLKVDIKMFDDFSALFAFLLKFLLIYKKYVWSLVL